MAGDITHAMMNAAAKALGPRCKVTYTQFLDCYNPPMDFTIQVTRGKTVLFRGSCSYWRSQEREALREKAYQYLLSYRPLPQPPRHPDDPIPLP